MNCLLRHFNVTAAVTRTPFTSILRNLSALPSTDACIQPKDINNLEEPDKLYKLVELELRGNEPAVIRSFAKFATTAAKHLDVQATSWNLRKPIHEKYTLLKSAFVHKKHRVQYETRTYYMFVQYKHLTGSTAETLLEYVERNLPEGVALKASKIELQTLPEYFKPPEEKDELKKIA